MKINYSIQNNFFLQKIWLNNRCYRKLLRERSVRIWSYYDLHFPTFGLNTDVVACTCNPASLQAEFRNGVGSIPVGVTVLR